MEQGTKAFLARIARLLQKQKRLSPASRERNKSSRLKVNSLAVERTAMKTGTASSIFWVISFIWSI